VNVVKTSKNVDPCLDRPERFRYNEWKVLLIPQPTQDITPQLFRAAAFYFAIKKKLLWKRQEEHPVDPDRAYRKELTWENFDCPDDWPPERWPPDC
jgi:hypothetical protein